MICFEYINHKHQDKIFFKELQEYIMEQGQEKKKKNMVGVDLKCLEK